jgi:hypothetical protein
MNYDKQIQPIVLVKVVADKREPVPYFKLTFGRSGLVHNAAFFLRPVICCLYLQRLGICSDASG